MGTLLLIVLVLFVVGALPTWPHSHNWGYVPSGGRRGPPDPSCPGPDRTLLKRKPAGE